MHNNVDCKCYIDDVENNRIINHTTGSSSSHPSNSVSGPLVLHQFTIKSVQNNQNLAFSADPPHKMWE